jgi:hypothetical protein
MGFAADGSRLAVAGVFYGLDAEQDERDAPAHELIPFGTVVEAKLHAQDAQK